MKPLSLDTDSPRWPAVVIQAAADASDELERMHNIAKRAKIMMVDDEELNLRAIEKTLVAVHSVRMDARTESANAKSVFAVFVGISSGEAEEAIGSLAG